MEQARCVFPFGFDHSFRGQLCADLRALQSPVSAESVHFLIERQIQIPPLKEGHDNTGKIEKKFQFGGKISALQYASYEQEGNQSLSSYLNVFFAQVFLHTQPLFATIMNQSYINITKDARV